MHRVNKQAGVLVTTDSFVKYMRTYSNGGGINAFASGPLVMHHIEEFKYALLMKMMFLQYL